MREPTASPAYPRDLRARARIHERTDWINTEVYRELGYHFVYPQILPHHVREHEGAQHATVRWGRDKARRALGILNDHAFADGPYLCGDRKRRALDAGVGAASTDVVSAAMSGQDHSLRLLGLGFECNFGSGSEVCSPPAATRCGCA
jgi:glutathione S-transferase